MKKMVFYGSKVPPQIIIIRKNDNCCRKGELNGYGRTGIYCKIFNAILSAISCMPA